MIFLRTLLRALAHPVTVINLMLVGTLCMIGHLHNRAHYNLEQDPDAYVFQWCRKNPDDCKKYASCFY